MWPIGSPSTGKGEKQAGEFNVSRIGIKEVFSIPERTNVLELQVTISAQASATHDRTMLWAGLFSRVPPSPPSTPPPLPCSCFNTSSHPHQCLWHGRVGLASGTCARHHLAAGKKLTILLTSSPQENFKKAQEDCHNLVLLKVKVITPRPADLISYLSGVNST